MVVSGYEAQTRWVLWLALTHVSIFGIALVGALWSREKGVPVMLVATGAWFLLQGVDEVVAGNFFKDGLHEYPILLGFILGLAAYLNPSVLNYIVRAWKFLKRYANSQRT